MYLMHFILGGVRLADLNFKNLREVAVRVHCLLGVDALGYLRPSFVEKIEDLRLRLGTDFVPSGTFLSFLLLHKDSS